jgi:hypothetical protein
MDDVIVDVTIVGNIAFKKRFSDVPLFPANAMLPSYLAK